MRLSLHTGLVFLLAMGVGILLALLSVKSNVSTQLSQWKKILEIPHAVYYREWLQMRNIEQATQLDVDMVKEMAVPLENHQFVSESHFLKDKVSVLCVIRLGKPKSGFASFVEIPQMMSSAQAISETWATHCRTLLLFSNMHFHRVPGVLQLKSSDMNSWQAMLEILEFLHNQKIMANHDWILFAEEDTYVIMENLNYFLSIYNASVPCYFGHAYRGWGFSFNDDGPGYVLSKAALRKLQSFISKGHCRWQKSDSAMVLGQCLSDIGIEPQDTRDNQGRARFLPRDPQSLIVKGLLAWSDPLWSRSLYVSPEGPDCCSDDAIAFHDISPNMMYIINYMVYNLKAYGVSPRLVLHTNLLSNFLRHKKVEDIEASGDNFQAGLKTKLGMPSGGQLNSGHLQQSGPQGKKYVNIRQN